VTDPASGDGDGASPGRAPETPGGEGETSGGESAGGVRVTVRVGLPGHLRQLAGVAGEVSLAWGEPAVVTYGTVVDAIEERFPALRGTIRDPATGTRRPFVRFFAGGEDLSNEGMAAPLPPAVASGAEVLRVVGAMAGG